MILSITARARDAGGAVATMVAVLVLSVSVTAQSRATAAHVKAAYLYNFANFASWPPAVFDGPASTFRVCTSGEDAFGSVLVDTFNNETVGGHAVTLLREPGSAQLQHCHILFVSAKVRDVDAILETIADAPVLTISDGRGFLERGGVIEFVMDAGRVRFDINLQAASMRGLTLSARLLQVARKVQQ